MIYKYIYKIHIYIQAYIHIYIYIHCGSRETKSRAQVHSQTPCATRTGPFADPLCEMILQSRLIRVNNPRVAITIPSVHCWLGARFITAMRCGAKINARRFRRRWLAGGGMAGGGMAVVVVVLGVALAALVFDLQLEVLRAHFSSSSAT